MPCIDTSPDVPLIQLCVPGTACSDSLMRSSKRQPLAYMTNSGVVFQPCHLNFLWVGPSSGNYKYWWLLGAGSPAVVRAGE